MMHIRLQKWGNSLAFRIPKAFLREVALTEGSTVDLGVKAGRLIITPLREEKISLADLLSNVKPSQIHGEEDIGAPQGQEVW